MGMSSERRVHGCGEVVSYYTINDAHDPGTVCQFVYKRKDGMAETGDFCPRCGKELTLENTRKVKEPAAKPVRIACGRRNRRR